MKSSVHGRTLIVGVVLALAAMLAAPVGAEEFSRAGKVDLYGVFQTMNGDTTSADDFGIELEMDDTSLYGFGLGVSMGDYFNLNTELLFGSTDIDVSGAVTETVDTDIFLWNVNLDYNVLKSRLTPLVSGGIGLANFSGSGFSEADFSYNVGAGVRWDPTDNLFVKAMYRWTWTELEDTDSNLMLDGFVVCAGLTW